MRYSLYQWSNIGGRDHPMIELARMAIENRRYYRSVLKNMVMWFRSGTLKGSKAEAAMRRDVLSALKGDGLGGEADRNRQ